eukprot:GEMP01000052.1.p1 GENE.GEMP01000052.1~~GEMP01000052.1.p1  ORF type:complete len:3639 (-),score=971.80 GEMP01000052.1:1016-11932(-)
MATFVRATDVDLASDSESSETADVDSTEWPSDDPSTNFEDHSEPITSFGHVVENLPTPLREKVEEINAVLDDPDSFNDVCLSLSAAFHLEPAEELTVTPSRALTECVVNHTVFRGIRSREQSGIESDEQREVEVLFPQLTEARADALGKVVSAQVVALMEKKCFDSTDRQIIWQELLQPYPWQQVEQAAMKFVLEHAKLFSMFSKRSKLQRGYELLRCLGPKIFDSSADVARVVVDHGEKMHCWRLDGKQPEIIESEVEQWLHELKHDAAGQEIIPNDPNKKELGYSLTEVKSGRYSEEELCILTRHLLDSSAHKLKKHDVDWQKCEEPLRYFLLYGRQGTGSKAPILQRFLTEVGEDFCSKRRILAKQQEKEKGSSDMGAVHTNPLKFSGALLELSQDPQKLDQKNPAELEKIILDIKRVWDRSFVQASAPFPKPLGKLITRDERNVRFLPEEQDEVVRHMKALFGKNQKALTSVTHAEIHECVLTALDNLDLDASAPKFQTLGKNPQLGHRKQVLGIFGALSAADDGRREDMSQSPVLVRSVKFQALQEVTDSTSFEAREIGLRTRGSYIETREMEENEVVTKFFEWKSPEDIHEQSQPLDQVLSRLTHIRLFLPQQKDGEDEPLDVDLHNPTLNIKGDFNTSYKSIPCRPRDANPEEFEGFRRFAVLVGPDLGMPLPKALKEASGTDGKGFPETADVLAEALQVYFRPGPKNLVQLLRSTPSLLFFASTALLDAIDPNFPQAREEFWMQELRLTPDNSLKLSSSEKESRELIFQLIAKDKRCCVLSRAHYQDLCHVLDKTKHMKEKLVLDESNFESARKELESAQDSTLTFFLVKVAGKLTRTQLAQLVDAATGSVRLCLQNFPSLIPSLSHMDVLRRVAIPPSLGAVGDLASPMTDPTLYRPDSPIGALCVTVCASDAKECVVENIRVGEEKLEKAYDWKAEETKWRKTDSRLLQMVTKHDDSILESYYHEDPTVFFCDASKPNALRKLEADLPGGLHSFSSVSTYILTRTRHVETAKLLNIIQRCVVADRKIAFIVPYPEPRLKTIRVTTTDMECRRLEAKVITVRNQLDVDKNQKHPLHKKVVKASRALRLIWGDDLSPSAAENVFRAIEEGVKLEEKPTGAWNIAVKSLSGQSETWLDYLSGDMDEEYDVDCDVETFGQFESNIQKNDLMEILSHWVPGKASPAAPAYMGTGPSDVALSREEVFHSLTAEGKDLDWEVFFEKWATSPDVRVDFLIDLMDPNFGHDAIKLLLSLPAHQIVELQLADSQKTHLMETLSLCYEVLNESPVDALAVRWAAIKWLLLSKGEIDHWLTLSAEETSLLIKADIIFLAPEEQEYWMAMPIAQVVPFLASFDEQGVLLSQRHARHWLMLPHQEKLEDILTTLGRSIVSFVFDGETRRELQTFQGPFTRNPFFHALLRWSDTSPELPSDPIVACFSEEAVAAMMIRAPRPGHAHHLAERVVEHRTDSAFWVRVVNVLTAERPVLVHALLEPLVPLALDFDNADCHLVAHLFRALKTKQLAAYLEVVANCPSNLVSLPLCLDDSDELRRMYIEANAPMTIHKKVLSESSCTAILGDLIEEKGPPSDLLWHCWARHPDRVLPQDKLPEFQNIRQFEDVLRESDFHIHCQRVDHSMSLLARYMIKPHTLSLAMYKGMSRKLGWIHAGTQKEEDAKIRESIYLVALEEYSDFPPYGLRWHYRRLPDEKLNEIMTELRGKVSSNPRVIFPAVTRGIDVELVRRNLSLILVPSKANATESGCLPLFHAVVVFAWARSAGLEIKQLLELVAAKSQDQFRVVRKNVMKAMDDPATRKLLVPGPLPTYVDVRWVESASRRCPLFKLSRDSANLTSYWLNTLRQHFALEIAECVPEQLVKSTGTSERDVREGPWFPHALEFVGQMVGRQIAKMTALTKDFKPDYPFSYDTQNLVGALSVLADFTFQMRAQHHNGSMDVNATEIETFFSAMVSAFADEKPSNLFSCCVFDAFFLLYGVSPENHGLEVIILTRAFFQHKLAISFQTWNEMQWLGKNYYGKPQNDSEVNQLFRRIRERLDSVIKLKMKKQEWYRYFENVPFIADVIKGQVQTEYPPYLRGEGLILSLPSNAPTVTENVPHEGPTKSQDDHTNGVSGDAMQVGYECGVATKADPESTTFFHPAPKVHEFQGISHWGANMLPDGSENDGAADIPVVVCRSMFGVERHEGMHLHAALRVKPGMQPILWNDNGLRRLDNHLKFNDEKGGGLNYKNGNDNNQKGLDDIEKVFANNDKAMHFLDSLPPGATLITDGFYLKKTDDGRSFMPIFPTYKHSDGPHTVGELEIREKRYSIWPYLLSFELISLRFDPKVLDVLHTIVLAAFSAMYPLAADGSANPLVPEEKKNDHGWVLDHVGQCYHKAVKQNSKDDAERLAKLYLPEEKRICECLLQFLVRAREQGRDSTVPSLLLSVVRSDDGSDGTNTTLARDEKLTEYGVAMIAPLSSIITRHAMAARTQLRNMLEICAKGSQAAERLLSVSNRITKTQFLKTGMTFLDKVGMTVQSSSNERWFNNIPDSDDDDDQPGGQDKAHYDTAAATSYATQNKVLETEQNLYTYTSQLDIKKYPDADLDREQRVIFKSPNGHGRPINSKFFVASFFDDDIPVYCVQFDRTMLRLKYSPSEGVLLGYILHKNLISDLLLDTKKPEDICNLREKLLLWICDWLRSPLSSDTKTWVLSQIENKGEKAQSANQRDEHVNLAVVAYCLSRKCPADTPSTAHLRSLLMDSWTLPAGVLPLVQRKSDMYGVYIVKGGTLAELQKQQLHVDHKDYSHQVAQNSLTPPAMYLDIIASFDAPYCCYVYVQGLSRTCDRLLKWLCEYTRVHPWRFIFLEDVDAAWNFTENRDRCNFVFSRTNAYHRIQQVEDLLGADIQLERPSHVVQYSAAFTPTHSVMSDLSQLRAFLRSKFDDTEDILSDKPPPSAKQGDFRKELDEQLNHDGPCIVCVVSPPGTGKTYHMTEARERLIREKQLDCYHFDCSSELLVASALSELLQKVVQGGNGVLVLDEYHMLTEDQKSELFDWLRSRAASMKVVLVANRVDSRDRDLLNSMHMVPTTLLETRLTRTKIEEVMQYRQCPPELQGHIADWLVCARLVFGDDATSLRLIDDVMRILMMPAAERCVKLKKLLLDKLPRLAPLSAEEFAAAFMNHTMNNKTNGSNGSFATLFRVALLDAENDTLASFVEILERVPAIYSAPPAVRLLVWAVYVLTSRNVAEFDLQAIASGSFVDQVGVPFQLRTASTSAPRAFSWRCDPHDLAELADASMRGHSLNLKEVKEAWSTEPVQDAEKLVRILSITRNPENWINCLAVANLQQLMRTGKPSVAVPLAMYVLKSGVNGGRGADGHSCGNPLDAEVVACAFWICVRDNTEWVDTRAVWEGLRGSIQKGGEVTDVRDMLTWASINARDLRRTHCDCEVKDQLIFHLLLAVSQGCEDWGRLWRGMFAPFLKTSASEEEENRWLGSKGDKMPAFLPAYLVQVVVNVESSADENWPKEVQILSCIRHAQAHSRDVNYLWTTKRHILLDYFATKPAPRPIRADFLAGILEVKSGKLDVDLQTYLLTSGCSIPDEISVDDFFSMVSEALPQINMGELSLPNRADLDSKAREELANLGRH